MDSGKAWIDMGMKLVRNDAFHTVEMDGDTLLYKPSSRKAIHMDTIASTIWKMCDGTRSTDDLAAELSSFYPEDADSVRADVASTVDMLLECGAISHAA